MVRRPCLDQNNGAAIDPITNRSTPSTTGGNEAYNSQLKRQIETFIKSFYIHVVFLGQSIPVPYGRWMLKDRRIPCRTRNQLIWLLGGFSFDSLLSSGGRIHEFTGVKWRGRLFSNLGCHSWDHRQVTEVIHYPVTYLQYEINL